MREERWTSLHELSTHVPRWGKRIVTSVLLVLILLLILILVLLHVVHNMGHPLHQLGLHSHQLLYGHGVIHRRRVGISPAVIIVVVVVVVVVVVGLPIVSSIGVAPSVDRHLMYRNNIIKSDVVHMCRSDM